MGVTWQQAVAYVKGGAAWAREKYQFIEVNQPTLTASQSRSGWTIGAGLESASHQIGRLPPKYDYIDFGTRNVPLQSNQVIAVDQRCAWYGRLNYRFHPPSSLGTDPSPSG